MKLKINSVISRSLSLIDRNPISNTFGCADRNYWHNNDGKGYSVDNFQVMCLGLSALYFETKNKKYYEFAKSVNNYFVRKVKNKGYSEEYFPGHESFCSMSYNLFATVVSNYLLGIKENNSFLKKYISKTLEINPPESANQRVALFCADLLFSKKVNRKYFQKNLNKFIEEKKGIDISYLSKMLSIISWTCEVFRLRKKKIPLEIYEIISQVTNVLNYYVIEKKIDILLGSRGNYHFLKSGLIYFSNNGIKNLDKILKIINKNQEYQQVINWEIADDKYFSFFHFNDEIFKFLYSKKKNKVFNIKNIFFKSINNLYDFSIYDLKINDEIFYINKNLIIQKKKYKKSLIYGLPIFNFGKNKKVFFISNILNVKKNKSSYTIFMNGNFQSLFTSNTAKSLSLRLFLKIITKISIHRKLINKWIYNKSIAKNNENIELKMIINQKKINFKLKEKNLKYINLNNYHYSDGHAARFIKLFYARD